MEDKGEGFWPKGLMEWVKISSDLAMILILIYFLWIYYPQNYIEFRNLEMTCCECPNVTLSLSNKSMNLTEMLESYR
jgi:hypothetical protein